MYTPKILIGPNSYSLTSLTAVATTDNLTLHYTGVDSDFDSNFDGTETVSSDKLQWSITFYNSSEERYMVSLQTGNYSIRICSSLNCLLRVTTEANQAYQFINCGKGQCFDTATNSCVVTGLANCAKCLGSSCLQCSTEYKLDSSGTHCVLCSDNFTMFKGVCE